MGNVGKYIIHGSFMGMMFVCSFVSVAWRVSRHWLNRCFILCCCFFHHVRWHVTSSWELRAHKKQLHRPLASSSIPWMGLEGHRKEYIWTAASIHEAFIHNWDARNKQWRLWIEIERITDDVNKELEVLFLTCEAKTVMPNGHNASQWSMNILEQCLCECNNIIRTFRFWY